MTTKEKEKKKGEREKIKRKRSLFDAKLHPLSIEVGVNESQPAGKKLSLIIKKGHREKRLHKKCEECLSEDLHR